MAGTTRGGRLLRIGGSAQRESQLSPGAAENGEEVLRLYREKYFDFSIRHFHEKLGEMHGIELSYTWVQQALQGAGLVKRRKQRGPHRRRRERRPLPGMLLHIDGSKHRWFSDDRYYDLLVILDDATSEIYYAQLVEEESTRTVMAGLREVIERKGLFCALYSDRGSHFFWTPKTGEAVDKSRLTQVGRAMKELGIRMIPAYSPQARGRCERNFGTWQGRLPQELRLVGIATLEEANMFLREHYTAEFNQSFVFRQKRKEPPCNDRAARIWTGFSCVQTDRVVARDNTIAFRDQCWQIEKTRWRRTLAGCSVTVHEHLDGRISVRYGPHVVAAGAGRTRRKTESQRRGKDGSLEAGENQKQVSSVSHTPLEISPKPRDFHFPTAPTTTMHIQKKGKTKAA